MQPSTQAPEREKASLAAGHRRLALSSVWSVTACLLPVAVSASIPFGAIDLAYLIRAGEIMIDSHHVLRTDPFLVWTIGRPWINQQWGGELIVAGAYRALGWLGLVVLRGVLQAGVLVGVFLAARAGQADRRRAAVLTLAAAILLLGRFSLRAELFGLVCFAASMWLIASRHSHPRRLWWVAVVTIFWANLHGSFFFAPLLLGLAWFEDLGAHDPGARRTLSILFVCLVATVVSPFGPQVWAYVKDVSTNSQVFTGVVEWEPTTVREGAGLLFFVSGALVVGFLARTTRSVPWVSLLRLTVFFAIGLASIRGTAWWGLILPVELAGLLPQRETARPDPAPAINWAFIGVLVLVVVVGLVRWFPYANRDNSGTLLTFAPAGITRELARILPPGQPFYNAQEWGSWFELALPGNPVTADSRFEVIPPNRWQQFVSVAHGREGWQDILNEWGIDTVVLSRHHPELLIPLMRSDPGWRLDYEDADGVIFVRS